MRVVYFILGAAGVLLMLGFSLVWLSTAGHGIYVWGGQGWLWGAIATAVFLRLMFPFTLGAFYCAAYVWDWHWYFAVLWALPGLAVALPGMVMAILGGVAEWARSMFRHA